MDVRSLILFLFFLLLSLRCFKQFSDSIEEQLVSKLQEQFDDVECPAGISLYRLKRDGVFYRVQIQARLPHNPSATNRIVKRCETTKSVFSSYLPLTGTSNEYSSDWGSDRNGMTPANSSNNVYISVDAWTSRLLHASCELIDYETQECDSPGSGRAGCGTKLYPSTSVMSYLLEVVNRPDVYNADDYQRKASETWSTQTLTKGIFPGTLWCGFGNIADDTFGKLGEHSETDDCCRTHDLCKPIIKAFQTRYSYSNPSIVPISHCACDMAFYNCLRRVDSPTSRMIGKIFFNLVKMKCFDFDVRHVCTSSILGLCLNRGEKCIAVIKQNKNFPD